MKTTYLPRKMEIYVPTELDHGGWDKQILQLTGGLTRINGRGSWSPASDYAVIEDVTIITVYSSREAVGHVNRLFMDMAEELLGKGEKSVLIVVTGIAKLIEP